MDDLRILMMQWPCLSSLGDIWSWNSVIKAYVRQGHVDTVFQLFSQMHHEGILPNKVTFLYILSAYGGQSALNDVKRLHTRIAENEFESDVFIGTSLVALYGKCGSLEAAWRMFETLPVRNVVSWTATIATYTQHGHGMKAVQLFEQMQQEGVAPNKVTYVSILAACAKEGTRAVGMRLHACIFGSGLESDVVVGTALVNMYGKCGCPATAQIIFDRMPRRNVVAWSAMIAVHAEHGHVKEVLQLFEHMRQSGVNPNRITFVSILAACGSQAAVAEGRQVHACILDSGFDADVVMRNALIGMYGKCGTEDAQKIFNKMSERNVVSWNSLITVYSDHGRANDAIRLFEQMVWEGLAPNEVTFISIVSACSSLGDLAKGKWIHGCIFESRFEADLVVGTALIYMYGKCGSPEVAQNIFDKMSERDIVAWNAMIAVHAEHHQVKEALKLFNQMQQGGIIPDKVTLVNTLAACESQETLAQGKKIHVCMAETRYHIDVVLGNALLNMYAKCGSLEHTEETFKVMSERNVISWTAVSTSFAQHGKTQESLHCFHRMQEEGIMPNNVTYVVLLALCSDKASLAEGGRMHSRILGNGFDLDVALSNALVSMYGKSGSLEDACQAYKTMLRQDTISWNGMIAVYAQHGKGMEALQLFDTMHQEGFVPDSSTFANVLAACSHAGLVNEGCVCFKSMCQDLGISPVVEHYSCMIDLFGRAGRLDEADSLISNMPLQPTSVSFMALLGACRHQADVARGEQTAIYALELDAEDEAPKVMLSNVHVAAGWGHNESRLAVCG